MLDEQNRRKKAAKIVAVTEHFLGLTNLNGLRTLDIGCSTGYIADELRERGAHVTGIDIDTSGLAAANRRFGPGVTFANGEGSALPFADRSIDLIVLNHIYEHVVDADALMTEIRRLIKPEGMIYLGLGNRFGVVEPHYRLPFLSWLPRPLADRYIRLAGKAPYYHEQFRSRRGLRRMCQGLNVWEYTFTVLVQPDNFASGDMLKGPLASVPVQIWRALTPIIPTYIWVATPSDRRPAGPPSLVAPTQVVRA
jgi:ubiquinone/menaquinone biosynthesis C-methylase UbiE